MNVRLYALLAALPARQLNLVLVGVVLIAAMLAWSVGLRAPLTAYRLQGKALAALEAERANTAPVATIPLDEPAPAAPLVAPDPLALIASVSRSAGKTGVTVSSAAQGPQATLAGLRMHTLDFNASGGYAAIMAWLADIEASQPTVGIAGFDLQPGATPAARQIRLQLTIYDIGTPP